MARERKSFWPPILAAFFITGFMTACAALPEDRAPSPVVMDETPAPIEPAPIKMEKPPGLVNEHPIPVMDATPVRAPAACGGRAKAASDRGSRKSPQVLLDEALEFCRVSQEFWQQGDPDNALEALDQAYALVLQVNGDEDPKMPQQKEDLRYLVAKRIMEIHASRHIVATGRYGAIPLVRNAHVEAEIKSLTGPERSFFIASVKRSGRYRTYIAEALRQAGLPQELSWLPLIESGFKVDALSSARALGLWQFIPSTGYKFGLKRDIHVDERLDPEKSTAAAIAYLKELHRIFGDWTTVLAAYNCGEGRVLRTIRKQNVNYLDNFWDLYEKLPLETARYVPRFLATLHILREPEAYGLEDIPLDPPLDYESITISRQVHLKDIAEVLGVEEKVLRRLNPELRYHIVPGNDYDIRIPLNTAELLMASVDALPVSTPATSSPEPLSSMVYHRVRKGETLWSIARRYGTSVKALMKANRLGREATIFAGRSLKVPVKNAKAVRSSSTATRHVVRRGDSLWILARRYGTTVPRIMAANDLSGPRLSIGQTLLIPAGQVEALGGLRTYSVRKGDTPVMIAKRFKMPLESLLQINHLTPRCTIYPGQTLKVR